MYIYTYTCTDNTYMYIVYSIYIYINVYWTGLHIFRSFLFSDSPFHLRQRPPSPKQRLATGGTD